jgi:hypothetical protein
MTEENRERKERHLLIFSVDRNRLMETTTRYDLKLSRFHSGMWLASRVMGMFLFGIPQIFSETFRAAATSIFVGACLVYVFGLRTSSNAYLVTLTIIVSAYVGVFSHILYNVLGGTFDFWGRNIISLLILTQSAIGLNLARNL